MTDLPGGAMTVPARLGVAARFEAGSLILELTPQHETLHHGVVRASVLSFLVDAAAGILVDQDPDVWTLTTDLSVRMRPLAAPDRIDAVATILRRGRRSATCTVELTDERGAFVAAGAVGFTSVPRQATDPPKPSVAPDQAADMFRGFDTITRPLREEAGIEALDAAAGVVQVLVTPALRNPAGTLQGAMVALVAEAAAEGLVAARVASPVVVTDLDVRYLAPAPDGPVRTRSRQLGSVADAPVEVALVDTSTDTVTSLVYARAVAAPTAAASS